MKACTALILLVFLPDLILCRMVSYFIPGSGCGAETPIRVVDHKPSDESGLKCIWVVYNDVQELADMRSARTLESDCFEHDIDYPGSDLLKVDGLETPEDCRHACQEFDQCLSFSFSWSCWLKPYPTSKSNHLGVTSGPVSCHCVERDVLYETKSLATINDVNNIDVCRSICQQYLGCTFYTLALTNHNSGGLYQDGDCILSGVGATKNASVSRYMSGSLQC